MACNRYVELLSARLDGALLESEEQELTAHLSHCPACRAVGAQLAALQAGFGSLEEAEAPENFAQDVMERIRTEEQSKVIPLFRRPQLRVLAGLAACLVLVAGLYGAARCTDGADSHPMLRFSQGAMSEELEDVPQIAAYSDSDMPVGDVYGAQKSAPDAAGSGADSISAAPMDSTKVLTLERMPKGGWELIPLEAFAFQEGAFVTEELFEKLEQMAAEQDIAASVTTSREKAEQFIIIVLDGGS